MKIKIISLFVLALASLSCTIEYVTPTPIKGSAFPLPTASMTIPAPVISTINPLPTPAIVGRVIAPIAIEIRDRPEGSGQDSHNDGGYLYPDDQVNELACQHLGPNIWVKHSRGWSIARNANTEFITNVCK